MIEKPISVVHLTSVHARYDTRIFKKMCVSLAQQGHKVKLVVADGKNDEIKFDVHIYDVGKSAGRFARIIKTTNRLFNKANLLDADIYHIHDPELLPIALKLKKLGKKVVYDIHEMTRIQILSKKWIPIFLRNLVSWFFSKYEDYACGKLDGLITPQEEMTSYFKKINKCITAFNYPEYHPNINRDKASRFNVIYAGSISEERGLLNYLNLIDSLVRIDSRYRLILACPQSDTLAQLIEASTSKVNIDYVGYLPVSDLFELYSKSFFGLILFNNVGQYYMANALKLFEYMSCGLFVVMPNFGSWIDFNNKYNVGINVDTSDSDDVAYQINNISNEFFSEISSRNVMLVEKKFSWKTEANKVSNFYKEII